MFAVGFGANQFTPMLVVYKHELGLSAGTQDALFGIYAIGLVPGLLLGGRASDRFGRRPLVLAFAAVSPIATAVLLLGHDSTPVLALGRLLAGACSGVVFSAASAWVQELSRGDAAPRRAAIALSAGFATGPLVAALVARWAPDPRVTAYLPHLLLGTVALGLVAIGSASVADATPLAVLLAAPPLGAAYGMILVGGLRETEHLARADERGATIAVFLALTYLGFGVPYVVSILGGGRGALVALAVAVAASLALTRTGHRRPLQVGSGEI